MHFETDKGKYLPLSSPHVSYGSREGSLDLLLRPIASVDGVISRVLFGWQRKTHQADPVRAWIFFDVPGQSAVRHPLRHDLQRFCCDADERDDIVMS